MTGIRRPDDDSERRRPPDSSSDLDQWLAELRVDAAGRERSRRRALVHAAAEEATVLGALADLAERLEPVVIEVDGDRLVRGVVRLVGPDVVVLRDGRTETIIHLDAVASIRLRPGHADPARPTGRPSGTPVLAHRSSPDDGSLTFARLLALLAETAPIVSVHRRGARSALSGTLTDVGHDVAVVHAPPAGTTYVPLWSVVDVSLTGSG